MHEPVSLYLILLAAFVTTASPGASTLAIAGASMQGGRKGGFAIASGITLGSWLWSAGAAFGLASIMVANSWIFEALRYLGASYLLFLAFKSARSAWRNQPQRVPEGHGIRPFRDEFLHGLLIHLTNPKVILFFASLYSAGIPADASVAELAKVVVLVGILSMAIFMVYVLAFSSPPVVKAYGRLGRMFDAVVAILFCGIALKLLSTTLPSG